jgi:putative acetyltransferase
MPASINIQIRPELPADAARIREVTRRAFAGRPYASGNEQDIIDALRANNALAVSLVADRDGCLIGHVAFSPASPEDGTQGWYTLGPVSVDPDVQRRGIGHALITAGLDTLREHGASGCIVLGDTRYYSRVGFVKAPERVPAPFADARDHFMVLSFNARLPSGVISFHPVFQQAG